MVDHFSVFNKPQTFHTENHFSVSNKPYLFLQMIKLIFVTYELKRMQYVHSNTGYYTKALYFQKSPLMEKNLLLQVILHRVNLILVLRNIKIAQNPNNSYPLNKPYLRLKTVKTISHTYLISKKRRTIFSKNIKPYVWLIWK